MKNQNKSLQILHQYLGFLQIPSLWINESSNGDSIFHLSKIYSEKEIDLSVRENTLLGKRAELFWSYQIMQNPRYKILHQNIQVHDNKITLGELDFIVHDIENDLIIHIELVCKIYLLEDNPKEEIWVGPNRKDGLKQKSDKLTTKQFPLLHHDLTQDLLSKNNINSKEIEQQLCFKALLFVHKKLYHTSNNYQINENCIIGWWIYFQEFNAKEYRKYRYYIPQKQNWFVDPKNNDTWQSYQEIVKEIKVNHETKNSPLCWLKSDQNEYQKFFIVWW